MMAKLMRRRVFSINTSGDASASENDALVVGDAGDNTLRGANNDLLIGGAGADAINGGAGDDTIQVGAGSDAIDGGEGTDTLSLAALGAGATVNLTDGTASVGSDADTVTGIENVAGSGYVDSITGDAGVNVIDGGGAGDTINAGDGDDLVIGGDGSDTLRGGAGDDTIYGDALDADAASAGTQTGFFGTVPRPDRNGPPSLAISQFIQTRT